MTGTRSKHEGGFNSELDGKDGLLGAGRHHRALDLSPSASVVRRNPRPDPLGRDGVLADNVRPHDAAPPTHEREEPGIGDVDDLKERIL